MGVAALILGIVSLILAFIPIIGIFAFIPAIIGLILGIVSVVSKSKKNEPKGMSIASIILTSISMFIIFIWLFVLPLFIAGMGNQMLEDGTDEVINIQRQLEDLNKQ